MTWEAGTGPTCFCGKPTQVFVDEKGPELICLLHSYDSGSMWDLADKKKPENWPNLNAKELILFLWPGTPEAEIDAWLATITPVQDSDSSKLSG